jgi:hypothetical protein
MPGSGIEVQVTIGYAPFCNPQKKPALFLLRLDVALE